jgi:hypothetical protein
MKIENKDIVILGIVYKEFRKSIRENIEVLKDDEVVEKVLLSNYHNHISSAGDSWYDNVFYYLNSETGEYIEAPYETHKVTYGSNSQEDIEQYISKKEEEEFISKIKKIEPDTIIEYMYDSNEWSNDEYEFFIQINPFELKEIK